MKNTEIYTILLNHLFNRVAMDYKETEQFKLLDEKIQQMNQNCQTMLAENEQRFISECFELLHTVFEQEKRYMYGQGISDSVSLLKQLGVLA